jgi:nitrate reductase assembly molybdenum cofactor insertion protein NarJ
MTLVDLDPRFAGLLRDAADWRVLGRLFERPSPEWLDDLDRLGAEVGDEALAATVRAAREGAAEGRYHSTFGPGGPAPPREASYHLSLELGNLMSELTTIYDAFGYTPPGDEPPDHVAIETGFIAYLRLKEAYALSSGEEETAQIARRAAVAFTTDHLAMFAQPLAALLAESDIEYLVQASAQLAARVGPKPSSRQLPVIQPDAFDKEEGVEFSCEL